MPGSYAGFETHFVSGQFSKVGLKPINAEQKAMQVYTSQMNWMHHMFHHLVFEKSCTIPNQAPTWQFANAENHKKNKLQSHGVWMFFFGLFWPPFSAQLPRQTRDLKVIPLFFSKPFTSRAVPLKIAPLACQSCSTATVPLLAVMFLMAQALLPPWRVV